MSKNKDYSLSYYLGYSIDIIETSQALNGFPNGIAKSMKITHFQLLNGISIQRRAIRDIDFYSLI